MTTMYDGTDVPVPVRCLGCALARPGRHQCAGRQELSVTGGFCQCTQPGCGGRTSTPEPADRPEAPVPASKS